MITCILTCDLLYDRSTLLRARADKRQIDLGLLGAMRLGGFDCGEWWWW
jgi:hypothetical protein